MASAIQGFRPTAEGSGPLLGKAVHTNTCWSPKLLVPKRRLAILRVVKFPEINEVSNILRLQPACRMSVGYDWWSNNPLNPFSPSSLPKHEWKPFNLKNLTGDSRITVSVQTPNSKNPRLSWKFQRVFLLSSISKQTNQY